MSSGSNTAKSAAAMKKAQKAELKKERLAENKQNQQKKAYTPEIVDPKVIQDAQHFLGRAMVCVVLPNLGGSGPTMKGLPLQRPVDQVNVRRLADMGGANAIGLHRTESANELAVGINPDFLDLASLTKAQAGPFPDVAFAEDVTDRHCTLFAGQHRIEAVKLILGETLKELEKVQKKVLTRPVDSSLEAQGRLVGKLKEHGRWLVAFYNIETLDADKDNRQSIILKLSTNNSLHAKPDTPQHHFKRVMCCLSEAEGVDYEATFSYATTLDAHHGMDVKTLLTKHINTCLFFFSIFKFHAFRDRDFHPKDWVGANKTIYGFLSPFLLAGKDQLLYLGSCFDNTATITNLELNDILNDPAKSPYLSHKVVNALIELADECYLEHLRPLMDYFGQESPAWSVAFNLYHQELKQQIPLLISMDDPDVTEQDQDVLQQLLSKVEKIYGEGLLTGTFSVPKLDGKVPLLCPGFIEDMRNMFIKIEPALQLIASWMVPGLGDQHKQRARATASVTDSNEAFHSDTTKILESLKYFYAYKVEQNWPSLDPDLLENLQLGEPPMPAMHHICNAWYGIIDLVLLRRNTVLVPNMDAIIQALELASKDKGKKKAGAEVSQEDQALQDAHILHEQNFQGLLKSWAESNYAAMKMQDKQFKKTNMHPRQMQAAPEDILQQVQQMPPEYQLALCGLQNTSYNWMTSKTGNNTLNQRTRFMKALLDEAQNHEQKRIPLLQKCPSLYNLRSEMLSMINGTPGLQHFQFWSTYIQPLEQGIRKAYDDSLVEENQKLFKGSLIELKFHKAWRTFYNQLASPDVLGIPVRDPSKDEDDNIVGYALHQSLEQDFSKLHQHSKQLLMDHKAIQLKDSSHQVEYDGGVESANWEDCPEPFTWANKGDMTAFYDMHKAEAVEQGDEQGLGRKRTRDDGSRDDPQDDEEDVQQQKKAKSG
ncbi:hypothetical protein M378DRAFT_16822 [Amanita muscaria Koide BX008]|uniref:Uncharacterized protein n=1 Tax=Amanita muscaria (strain Koide BX008) TaxID=946122 RepID=A0A0C2S245_AMAMK|nr:hypothetical protein M378DRAFT_16822 [Amanita muscaria Koide BX008]